jgi:glycosyltransferase involved in cell wall biosynthesis
MLRIALLVDSPSRGAHGNAASRLAIGLAQTGEVEATLLSYGDGGRPPGLPAEVIVERLGPDRASRALRPLVRYLRRRNPDVLITRQIHANFVGLAAARLARLRGWPGRVVLVQDHPIELSHASNPKDNKWVAKAVYRFADGVITPSPAVRADIMRWCGLAGAAVAVVPNPIPRIREPYGDPPDPWLRDGQPPVFVNASNMSRWKRLDLLVEAFAEVRAQHHARLLIVGDGPGRDEALAAIERLRLGDDARLTGWVTDPLLYAAHACAYVHASDEEGFSQVLIEAMSVGCPVISTDAVGGGPSFVTRQGRCGLLVPRGDRAGLAEAMSRMLQPAVRSEYSALARQRAAELSPEASAALLMEFLTGYVGLDRPRPDVRPEPG